MNRVAIHGWALCAALFGWQSPVLAGNSLDVEFSGELVSTACQVAAESINKKITLYNLRWQFINEKGTSEVTPFTIAIDKCSETDLQKSIKLTWKSNELVNIGSESFLTTKGDSGVLLGLIDHDEKPIVWNKPITIGDINTVENLQQFDFGVYVRKPITGEAKVGDFSGIVTFNMEYE
ncbi:MAG TPA: type 1 fimbrial protein [Providencia sp.]|uniref:fimbrial protein n=1 Tax=Providencia sp. TaxID=589 RepID=UPI000E7D604B|nr:fimbrial protein [Providencia sp.]MBP6081116.1 type 1 fimbrial protein [Providencia sp.]HBO24801.1 type 1 fimbrial protein [Providencia sp.]